MPTDLPPDYKPKPARDPNDPTDASAPGAVPIPPGSDVRDGGSDVPQPGPNVGVPGPGVDVIDPTGWSEPPLAPGGAPIGVPTPAGTPTF